MFFNGNFFHVKKTHNNNIFEHSYNCYYSTNLPELEENTQ